MQVTFPENTLFLVTGGAGFIGSHLCETLLAMGHRVRCLDNLSTGKREHVEMFSTNPRYEFIEGDIKDLATCLTACEGVDFVLHQAAWGSVPRSIEMPLSYNGDNLCGTLNVLEAARQSGVKRVVYASSSSVYGDEPTLPKKEGREGQLLSPYALTKRACEEWAKQYTRHYGLFTCGLRYFNVFGPRQNPNGPYAAVIPRWMGEMKNGKQPTVYGDGTQSRDFTYVDNAVQANLKACLAPEEAAGRAFNVACGERVTLLEVFEHLAIALGKKDLTPQFADRRAGDIVHSLADIEDAKRILGYTPSVSFAEGIQKTVKA